MAKLPRRLNFTTCKPITYWVPIFRSPVPQVKEKPENW